MTLGAQDFRYGSHKDKRAQKAFNRSFQRLLDIEEKNKEKRHIEIELSSISMFLPKKQKSVLYK